MNLSVSVTGDVRLRVRHWPGTRSRAFLLVHGLSSNATVWDEVAGRLAAAGHPAYAVDLRGHGESDAPADGYDTATAAADVAAAGAALGLTGAVVAGHSWGGSVALRLAAEHPELVAGLALVDGGWVDMAASTGSWEQGARMVALLQRTRNGRASTTLPGMREYLRAAHPGWSQTAIEAHLADMRVNQDGSVTPRLPEAHFTSIVRSLWDEPPARWYPSITVPVMLLPAIHSDYPQWERQSRAWVAKAEEALARTTVRWYRNADHHLHCEHPERLANDLLDLARGIAAGPD